MNNYSEINYRVMKNTEVLYESLPELKDSIKHSISKQKIYWENDQIPPQEKKSYQTKIIISSKTTLEAAKEYAGQRLAILNFANNHSVGGSPFSAGAQEESICRSSTLFPCLKAHQEDFYNKHINDFRAGKLDVYGNDDTIFTPGVTVFKEGHSEPQVMYQRDWFSVDVITTAAPELGGVMPDPDRLESLLAQRIKRILDIAEAEGEEVLILGAFGCGAFRNPPELVARLFKEALANYSFKIVEFAIKGHGNGINQNYLIFKDVFENEAAN